jgi:hypothetical protein
MADKHRVICEACGEGHHDDCMGVKGRNACVCDNFTHPDTTRRALPGYPDDIPESADTGPTAPPEDETPTRVESDVRIVEEAEASRPVEVVES